MPSPGLNTQTLKVRLTMGLDVRSKIKCGGGGAMVARGVRDDCLGCASGISKASTITHTRYY